MVAVVVVLVENTSNIMCVCNVCVQDLVHIRCTGGKGGVVQVLHVVRSTCVCSSTTYYNTGTRVLHVTLEIK